MEETARLQVCVLGGDGIQLVAVEIVFSGMSLRIFNTSTI